MKSVEAARELAGALGETARLAGLKARLAITDMSQPLGRTVGNALEVMEAAAVLTGNEPSRFCELCLRLAALTLVAAEVTWDLESGYDRARGALVDGSALLKAESWFEAQGADPTVLVRPDLLPQAAYRHRIEAPNEGFVSEINAEAVGHAAVLIGAGRVTKEDLIDPSAGIEVHVEVGSQIQKGQPVFTIHARDESSALAVSDSLTHAIRVSETRVDFIDPVIEILNPPDARS
jgi:pyrimidine-nucleoside phosphorylase